MTAGGIAPGPHGGAMKKGLFVQFHEFLARPFNSSGSAFQWTLFLGFLIIVIWMWNSVLLLFVRKTAAVAKEVAS